jgi:MFS family permease
LTEAPRPESIRRNPRAPWFAVGVVCFGAFMGQLDASIVTLTFRPMERDFAAPLAGVQWVSLSYLLVLVAMLAPAGRVGDSIGRKLVYQYGFGVFTVGSAMCAFAPSLGTLVGFRLLQAIGAAMLQANSVALVTTSVPRSQMRLALSVQAAAQSIGLALGPTLGGLLTQAATWRAVYWVNVPVGIVALVAGRYLLPRTRHFSRTDVFDWPGAVALGSATTALLLVLSAVSGLPLPGWATIALAVLAAAAALAFAGRERRARFPLIDPALIKSLRVVLGLVGAFLGYLALFGPLVLVPQVLTGTGGEFGTGLVLSALPVGFGVAALTVEKVLPGSVRNRTRAATGAAICAVGLSMLIFVTLQIASVVLLLALAGLGLGMFVPANNAVIMRSAGADKAAVLGGLVNMARGIGTTFGIALVTLALHLSPRAADGRPGHALAFAVLAIAAALAIPIVLAIRPLRDGAEPGTAAEEHSSAFS